MKAGYAFFIIMGLASIGLFFSKGDLTGNVVFDEGVKPICSMQDDCKTGTTCCLFYGETSGVCGTQSKCSEVLDVTKTQSDMKAMYVAAARKEIEAEHPKTGFELFFGLATVALIAFLMLRWSSSKEASSSK